MRQHLQLARVDGGDLVVGLGGDVDRLAVGAEGDPLRLVADGDLARDLPGGEVEHAHLGGLLVRDVERLAVARQIEGLGILPALQRAQQLVAGEIDDADAVGGAIAGRQLRLVDARPAAGRSGERDVEQLAVARQLDAARALADGDAGRDRPLVDVDHDDLAALFTAHVGHVGGRCVGGVHRWRRDEEWQGGQGQGTKAARVRKRYDMPHGYSRSGQPAIVFVAQRQARPYQSAGITVERRG